MLSEFVKKKHLIVSLLISIVFLIILIKFQYDLNTLVCQNQAIEAENSLLQQEASRLADEVALASKNKLGKDPTTIKVVPINVSISNVLFCLVFVGSIFLYFK